VKKNETPAPPKNESADAPESAMGALRPGPVCRSLERCAGSGNPTAPLVHRIPQPRHREVVDLPTSRTPGLDEPPAISPTKGSLIVQGNPRRYLLLTDVGTTWRTRCPKLLGFLQHQYRTRGQALDAAQES
jgi:hypothetical protein